MAAPGTPTDALIHLARRTNGEALLEAFLRFYSEHAAGVPHDLVVILKGYDQESRTKETGLEALRRYRAQTLEITDEGFDLHAYRDAVRAFSCSHYCVLNSFSRFTAEGLLKTMMQWAVQPTIGIVGVTGSYQSVLTDELDVLAGVFGHHMGKLSSHSPLGAHPGVGTDPLHGPPGASVTIEEASMHQWSNKRWRAASFMFKVLPEPCVRCGDMPRFQTPMFEQTGSYRVRVSPKLIGFVQSPSFGRTVWKAAGEALPGRSFATLGSADLKRRLCRSAWNYMSVPGN